MRSKDYKHIQEGANTVALALQAEDVGWYPSASLGFVHAHARARARVYAHVCVHVRVPRYVCRTYHKLQWRECACECAYVRVCACAHVCA
jgi:hypothetical protein